MVGQICLNGHCLEPRDAKQCPEGQICPYVPHTNDILFFLHTFLCQRLN